MNLVLADTEEFRRTKKKSKPAAPGSAPQIEAEEKRTLGLTIVRGTQVVSCSVDGPPPADPSARLGAAGPGAAATLAAGPGISKPAGRGLPVGLGGPAAGVGGPPPPGGFGFPPAGFPGAPPPGFAPGRGGPPGGPRKFLQFSGQYKTILTDHFLAGFAPPPGFAPQGGPRKFLPKQTSTPCATLTLNFVAAGFQPPPGFQPPGQGRGYPPPGFGGR
jgi:small nuclear ribonucleoprotein B and B'